jgi:uncharacterized integral membrane protein (TIGR00698 family)
MITLSYAGIARLGKPARGAGGDMTADADDPQARRFASLSGLAPGLAVTGLATLAAGYVSDHYGAPLTLMCLLFGLSLSFLSVDPRLSAGLAFASRTLLRWGIVLVAARMTLGQVAHLGPRALVCIIAIVAATLATGVVAARRLGFSGSFGALCGGAVAICGASAAMAIASLLGERRISQAQLALVIVAVSALSALGMTLYPVMGQRLGLDDLQAGFLLGASIHDVAQSVGAGFAYSPGAGAAATIVKLSRVALLAPCLLVIALFIPRQPGARMGAAALPWFVLGFFGLAALNSTGAVPAAVAGAAAKGASALLACAVTATGLRSQMQSLMTAGLRPLVVILLPTLVALLLSVAAAVLLIR